MANLFRKFKGGIHPPQQKNTKNLEVVEMPIPKNVVIPVSQHIGAFTTVIVKKGDQVKVGQKICDSDEFISAPIHASVSGKVIDVKAVLSASGAEVMSVFIESDGKQELHPDIKPLTNLTKEELVQAIRESGLVGLGGAGFPTHVKLSPPKEKVLDTLIVNAAECEPYITSDYREMIENAEGVISGIKIVMDLLGIKNTVIGIESNKPIAIKKFKELLKDNPSITVKNLPTRYPQGGEKQLVYAVTKKKVPSGGLPLDVGVLVQNVATLSFIDSFIKTGMPLIKKTVTVDGSAVKNPMNVKVPVGTMLKDVFEFCGGFTQEPYKVIMGGPMMGVSQFSLENPIIKNTNAILALTKKDAIIPIEGNCIRCGRCIAACPMRLLPLRFHANVRLGRIDDTLDYNIRDCIECGCCSYVCPSKLYLVQSIRFAKSELMAKNDKK